MKIKEVQAELRKHGIVLTHDFSSREFRVNFKGGSEGTAYYTDDLEDAYETGMKMYEEKSRPPTLQNRPASANRKAAVDLHNDVAKAAKKYLDEAKAQGLGDDKSSILDKLKKSWPYLVVSYLTRILEDVMTGNILDENRYGARMDRSAASQALDRVADHLERLRQEIPREASNLRGLALRLDRVANTLEAEGSVAERVSGVERELEKLGLEFSLGPTSSKRHSADIYVYRGQLGREEEGILRKLAGRYGLVFDSPGNTRAYKLTVPHQM